MKLVLGKRTIQLRRKISRTIPIHIVKNASLLGVANVVLKLTGMVIGIMIARALGRSEFGAFTLGMAYAGLSLTLAQLGLNTLARREIARDHSRTGTYMGKLLPLMTISFTLTFFLVWASVKLLGYDTDTRWVILLMFIVQSFESLCTLCLAVFIAHEKMKYVAAVEVGVAAVKVVSTALLLHNRFSLTALIISFLLISVAKFFLELSIVSLRFGRFRVNMDLQFWKGALTKSLPIAATEAPSFVLLRLDTILLSILVGETAVGLYNAAYNLFLGMDVVPRSLFGAIFPRLSTEYAQSVPRTYNLYKLSLLAIAAIGVLLGTAFFLLAEPIILLFYGTEFSQAVVALRILALALPIFFVSSVCKGSLIAIDQQVINMYIAFGGALLNTILNLLVIPKLSFIGASISTGVTYLATSATMLVFTFYFFKTALTGTELATTTVEREIS